MQDWISLPLVGFPLIASFILLAFVSRADAKMRERLNGPIRMACLVFSFSHANHFSIRAVFNSALVNGVSLASISMSFGLMILVL